MDKKQDVKVIEKDRILELRELLEKYNREYYINNAPSVSDIEFDVLMHELEALELLHPELLDINSPTRRVGQDISKEFTQVEHKYPMLSLGNTYNEGEIRDFDKRVRKLVGDNLTYVCELKYDGTSISLIYKDGNLIKAVTRGDGIRGDDVTNNVRTIRTVPLKLIGDYPPDFEIRGEIFMPFDVFEQLNEEKQKNNQALFANPRNAAAGTLKMQNSSIVAKRNLMCYLYYIPGETNFADTHYDNLQKAKTWGLNIAPYTSICSNIEDIMAFIDKWDKERSNLNVPIDGVVIKVNNVYLQNRLGYTAKTPRWAIAYKFKAERIETKLLSVTYQVGRTGTVTPVANLSPVHIAGTTVKRATLHNADIIKELDLHENDYVFIEKGGEIIPKIVAVNSAIRAKNAKPIQFIEFCPSCGTKLIREDGEARYYCPAANVCLPQIIGGIEHFVSRQAMNIDGFGKEISEMLVSSGIIKNVADIYSLVESKEKLLGMEKIFYPDVYFMPTIPLSRVIYAFGIGIKNMLLKDSRLIANKYMNLRSYSKATLEELIGLKINSTNAIKIINYFKSLDSLFTNDSVTLGRLMECGEVEFIPTDYIIYAMNIPGIDLEKSNRLAMKYDFLYNVYKADYDSLMSVNLINSNDAISILTFFKANSSLVRKLNTLQIFRLQKTSVDKLLLSIEKSKERGFIALLYGLGIRHIGITASRMLANHFKNVDNLIKADYSELVELDDFGEQMANSVLDFFRNKKNLYMINKIKSFGVVSAIEDNGDMEKIFEGKNFVITGKLTHSRDYFKDIILNNGGGVNDSVSSKTNYLIAGEKAGSKLQKARKLGIEILNEEQFREMLNNNK